MNTRILVVLLVVLIASCASGPTREEIAREESERSRKRAEEDDKKRRTQEALVKAQQELIDSRVVYSLDQNELKRTRDLLETINQIAGERVQRDLVFGILSPFDSDASTRHLKENPKPLFVLDERTGVLTLRLSPEITREVLLRHVHIEMVRPGARNLSTVIAGQTVRDTNSWVDLPAKAESIRELDNGKASWTKSVSVDVANLDQAGLLMSAFKELAQLWASK